MSAEKKERRALARELKQERAKHARLLKKVHKARLKYERRAEKLQRVEANLAELQRRFYEPGEERLGQAAQPGQPVRKARLIYNPDSGEKKGSRVLQEIVETLRANGLVAEIALKTSGKAAREMARAAADAGDPLVIVAAGDGTIEDVAAQLVGTKTALGIIPIGTMNNLARALGVPLEMTDACTLLGMGTTRSIDLGRVKGNGQKGGEYFMETAGAGLSAIVIPAGQAVEKGRWGEVPGALRELLNAESHAVTITLDDQVVHANTQLVTVSNSPLIGSNLLIAPEAKMDDGLLDVAVYEDMGKAELLPYFLSLSSGKRANNDKVKFYRSAHVKIESDQPLQAHSDKEPLDASQVLEFDVVPHALSAVVGQGIALTLPVQAAPDAPPLSGAPSNGEVKEGVDKAKS